MDHDHEGFRLAVLVGILLDLNNVAITLSLPWRLPSLYSHLGTCGDGDVKKGQGTIEDVALLVAPDKNLR